MLDDYGRSYILMIFAILGFKFLCSLSLVDEDEFGVLLDAFLDFIEDRKLCMGGGSVEFFSAFICSTYKYGSASEEDRKTITHWLKSQEAASNIIIGQLVDANYGIVDQQMLF